MPLLPEVGKSGWSIEKRLKIKKNYRSLRLLRNIDLLKLEAMRFEPTMTVDEIIQMQEGWKGRKDM
jgi:hypothetical protein